MTVADGYSERICGITGRELPQAEQHADHVLNLILRCMAAPGHRLLYLVGRIFVEGKTSGDACHQSGAARLAELERRSRVAMEKNLLDSKRHRPFGFDDRGYAVEDCAQSRTQIVAANVDAPACHVTGMISMELDAVGSKSEREVAVLNASGLKIRIFLVGDNPFSNQKVRALDGKTVTAKGCWKQGTFRIEEYTLHNKDDASCSEPVTEAEKPKDVF